MTTTNQPAEPANPAKLLNISEACDALRISRWSMYQLINQRRVKTVRVRGRHLIAPQDLDDFIERLRAEGDVNHA